MRLSCLALAVLAWMNPLDAQEASIALHDDPDAREFVITIGPVDLPAAPMGGHAHDAAEGGHESMMFMPPVREVSIPFDAFFYGFHYDLTDANGNPVPRELLHHLNVIDPYHRDLFLPISYRVAAAGSETGPMHVPRLLFGQPLEAGQRLAVSAMLHNPTGTDHRGVTVHFRLSYVKSGRPWPLFTVYSFQVDVAFPAGDKDFDLPPGRSTRSWEGSPAIGGRIVAMGAHLHAHAVSVVFEDATNGKRIYEGKPVVDADGRLVGVTVGRLYRRLGVRIHPDRVYRVTVTYDNPTGDTITAGGMGVVAGLVIPAVDEWPAADATDALYALDRRHYLREVRGAYDEIVGADSAVTAGHTHPAR